MTNGCGGCGGEKKKPIEDAPFHIYLKILHEEGYIEDAELMKAFYIELLTNVDMGDGKTFTYDQVMQTPYKNLVKSAEIIMQTAQREMQLAYPPINFQGTAMRGKGAEKLSPDSLQRLAQIQLQRHEEEKLRLAIK